MQKKLLQNFLDAFSLLLVGLAAFCTLPLASGFDISPEFWFLGGGFIWVLGIGVWRTLDGPVAKFGWGRSVLLIFGIGVAWLLLARSVGDSKSMINIWVDWGVFFVIALGGVIIFTIAMIRMWVIRGFFVRRGLWALNDEK